MSFSESFILEAIDYARSDSRKKFQLAGKIGKSESLQIIRENAAYAFAKILSVSSRTRHSILGALAYDQKLRKKFAKNMPLDSNYTVGLHTLCEKIGLYNIESRRDFIKGKRLFKNIEYLKGPLTPDDTIDTLDFTMRKTFTELCHYQSTTVFTPGNHPILTKEGLLQLRFTGLGGNNECELSAFGTFAKLSRIFLEAMVQASDTIEGPVKDAVEHAIDRMEEAVGFSSLITRFCFEQLAENDYCPDYEFDFSQIFALCKDMPAYQQTLRAATYALISHHVTKSQGTYTNLNFCVELVDLLVFMGQLFDSFRVPSETVGSYGYAFSRFMNSLDPELNVLYRTCVVERLLSGRFGSDSAVVILVMSTSTDENLVI